MWNLNQAFRFLLFFLAKYVHKKILSLQITNSAEHLFYCNSFNTNIQSRAWDEIHRVKQDFIQVYKKKGVIDIRNLQAIYKQYKR